jgi:hypothetical protein
VRRGWPVAEDGEEAEEAAMAGHTRGGLAGDGNAREKGGGGFMGGREWMLGFDVGGLGGLLWASNGL